MEHDLDRFVTAQASSWPAALAEITAGAKRSHWMWFIFPQIAGLARSETARFYAIESIGEARAYLAHPLLGPRLVEATRALMGHAGRSPEAIMGGVDAIKLRSSLTLFEVAGEGEAATGAALDGPAPFGAALDTFFAGERDAATLRLLGR